MALALGIVSLSLATPYQLAARQRALVAGLEREWRDLRWPVESYGRTLSPPGLECADWVDLLDVMDTEEARDQVAPLAAAMGDVVCALTSGEAMDSVALPGADLDALEPWLADTGEALATCSFLQPARIDEDHHRLPIFGGSRSASVSALAAIRAAARGRGDDPAAPTCEAPMAVAEQLRGSGHPVIDALFALAAEGQVATCHVAVRAATGRPWTDADASRIRERAGARLHDLFAASDAERAYALESCREP